MATPAEPYSSQLDALRGLAVAAVLVHHYLPSAPLPLGGLGVKLFFVLSGYLITQKLLDCRGYVIAGQSLGTTLKRFYARRTLRIFPLYYLTLTVTALADVERARDLAPWTFSYATNFFIALRGDWPGPFSPFWTLAVEEQFYLVWPWFILLAPGPWLWRGCLLAVAVAPSFRALAIFCGLAPDQAGVLPLSCLDTLGIGAAAAIATHPAEARPRFVAGLRRGAWAATLIATMLFLGAPPIVYAAGFDVAYGWAMAALVLAAVAGIGGRARVLLDNGMLVRLGKISYGVYALHAFAPLVMKPALEHPREALGAVAALVLLGCAWVAVRGGSTGLRALLALAIASLLLSAALILGVRLSWVSPEHRDIGVYFGLCWLVSVAAATLSWVAFEEPLNRFKRYFPYRDRSVAVRPAGGA